MDAREPSPPRTSRRAVECFVSGLAGLVILVGSLFAATVAVPAVLLGIAAGVAALVLGRSARIELDRHPELGGRKLALAGTVIGILLIIPAGIFVFTVLPMLWHAGSPHVAP